MRIGLLALGSLLITILGTGCAGTPTAPTPAAQAKSATEPVRPAAAPVSKDGPLTAERALALQHGGYTIVKVTPSSTRTVKCSTVEPKPRPAPESAVTPRA